MNAARTLLASSIASLVLAGCGSAPTRVYSLTPAPPAARIGSPASMLRVDAVHVPPAWDRIEILSSGIDGALEIDDLDRWSAPLAQATRQMLTADLDLRLPAGSVIYPHLAKPPGALGVSIEILQFTITQTQASMQAGWIIDSSAAPEAGRRDFATVTMTVTDPSPATVARTWSALLGQLADHIAADASAFPIIR
jgi:uncharacterized lipoprotein YmbA